MDIDEVDFSILKVLAESDSPMWKTKIHRKLVEEDGGLPHARDISVQTVGRRVDDLLERELVESCIISPQEINRDLIIAFKPSEDGVQELENEREELLREYISVDALETGSYPDEEILADLAVDELGADPAVSDSLQGCDTEGMWTLLSLHYLKEDMRELVDEEHLDSLVELATHDREIAATLVDGFMEDDYIDTIRDEWDGL